MEIITAAELMKKEFTQLVKYEDGYISIKYYDDLEYDIERERCDSYHKILTWVHHLSMKTWFTTEMCVQFIDVACEASGLKELYGNGV